MARIEIYVDGIQLDMGGDGFTITRTDFRFNGGNLGDDYSTDFELPRTENNQRLLGVFNEFYVGLPASFKNCLFVCEDFTANGRIFVTSTTRETITATIYLSRLMKELDDLNLRDFVTDDDYHVHRMIPWDRVTPGQGNGNCPAYVASLKSTLGRYKAHPVILVEDVKNALYNEYGITIDDSNVGDITAFEHHAVVSTGKCVSTANDMQCIFAAKQQNTRDFYIVGGQHISNDLDSKNALEYLNDTSKYEWQMNKATKTITFNRTASVYFYAEIYEEGVIGSEIVCFARNGTTFKNCTITGNQHYSFTFDELFVEGDKLTIELSNLSSDDNLIRCFVKMNIGCQITEEDVRKVELNYLPGDIEWSEVGVSGGSSHADWSYSVFDIWENAPDVTVKELFSTLACMFGCSVEKGANFNEVVFSQYSNTNAAKIGSEIVDDVSDASDIMARDNLITFADGSGDKTIYADVEGIEDSREFFVSVFNIPKFRRDGLAILGIYDVIEEDRLLEPFQYNWQVTYNDIGAIIAYCYIDENLDNIALRPPYELTRMGLPEKFDTLVKVSGTTIENLRDASLLIIDGIKFYIIETEYDSEDGTYHFEALKG